MPNNEFIWRLNWRLNRFRTMTALPEYVSVYFQDEIPRLGCGWRRLLILSRDSEWTIVLSPASAKAAKIKSTILHNCKPRTLLPEVDYSVLFLSNRLREIAGQIVSTYSRTNLPKVDSDSEDLGIEIGDFDEEETDDEDDLDVRQILARFAADVRFIS